MCCKNKSTFWIKNDIWIGQDRAFGESGIYVKEKIKTWTIADFTTFKQEQLKNEMKYFILKQLKENVLTTYGCTANYLRAIRNLGEAVGCCSTLSFADINPDEIIIMNEGISDTERRNFRQIKYRIVRFIRDIYDEKEALDKDKWYAREIPGVKLSAAIKRQCPSVSFEDIPTYYRETLKKYMKTLIYRRSWSFCREILMYIRYFYRTFYEHGYGDGFQENLSRSDMEKYLRWVSEDYENKNATFKSKAISYVRNWLDFIQLAEFDTAPKKDVTRLIFDEDIPKRERASNTLEKVKYIPEPVRLALDAAIDEIKPAEMKPVYILLRETGWRGTDILNLRYDQCLDYVWNSRDEEYVPYLYDEITKTGIPLHKIPIRPEVAEMVASLITEAKEKSTDDNNPDKYLFNTYEGKCKGLPYSKQAFADSVNELIARKEIRDGSGEIYHFKTHSLRHTRAMEYTEQGMPIGIIQQILGHCSLQMTLHYSKDSMLFRQVPDGPSGYDDGSFLRKYGCESGADSYCIYVDGQLSGVTIVFHNPREKENFLGCLFLSPSLRGKGMGTAVWDKIEKMYPDVKVWRTETPLYSRRNLNFYINKLGFMACRITDPMQYEHAQVQFVKYL